MSYVAKALLVVGAAATGLGAGLLWIDLLIWCGLWQ